MNYSAPTRIFPLSGKKPKVKKRMCIIYEFVERLLDFFLGGTLYLLNMLGCPGIPNALQFNIPLCSLCICGALLGITSSLGVALGVGLGVGLNCAETQNIFRPNQTYTNISVPIFNTTVPVVAFNTSVSLNNTSVNVSNASFVSVG